MKIFLPHAIAARRFYCACSGMSGRSTWLTVGATLLIGVLSLITGQAQTSGPQKDKTDAVLTGNAEAGKKTFMKDGCFECHGTEGQGAAQGAGPRIGPPQLSQEALIKYVRHPSGQMPPYTSKVISDQELADIFAFLQSRPKAAPGKDIPLLNE